MAEFRMSPSSEREIKFRCRLFTSCMKRKIRHFHVVVVQKQERNVQKSVITCKVVVLLIKPIVFLTFSLPSASLDLKVSILLTSPSSLLFKSSLFRRALRMKTKSSGKCSTLVPGRPGLGAPSRAWRSTLSSSLALV